MKLGFSIDPDTLGYGVLIPHWGTIVVGRNTIGNYAVLHTNICISGNGKQIGDGLYMATGAKITAKINLGDGITVGANAVVNKSYGDNLLLVGIPAISKKNSDIWYQANGDEFARRVEEIEKRRKQLFNNGCIL